MVNKYLFLAYSFVWLIFMVYAWILSRRQARLNDEVADLRRRLETRSGSTAENRVHPPS